MPAPPAVPEQSPPRRAIEVARVLASLSAIDVLNVAPRSSAKSRASSGQNIDQASDQGI